MSSHPKEGRYLLVGTEFESAPLNDDKLNLADRMGFRIVVDQTVPADAAYAFASSAFIVLSGVPSVPHSVPCGATTSFENIALCWVRDYDPLYMQDRSVVNTYAGFRSVTDVLVGWDEANEKEIVSTQEYFVRGIKLQLDGASDYPAAGSELATITSVSDAKVWAPTGMKAETDPANA